MRPSMIRSRACAPVALPLALVLAALPAAAIAQSPAPGISMEALAAEVEEITGQVETMRGIDSPDPIPFRLADRDAAMSAQLDEITGDPKVADRMAQDERIYTRLGLLPAGSDLMQSILDLLQEQVAGYYDPKTKQLTVIDSDSSLDLASRVTLAHELDHALQDQRWDLQGMQDAIDPVEGDQASAVQALIEGDATLLMLIWSMKHAASDLTTDAGVPLPGMESLVGVPQLLQRQLFFPYLDGFAFLNRAWGPGGWEAVDAVWDAPPVSTEQVMHPERYPDELPIPIALPDLAPNLGDGWSVTGETVMGELNTGIWVADGAPWDPTSFSFAGQQMPNASAADGWGGDRLVTLDGPDGAWGLLWQTAWDTPEDAAEFRAAAIAALADLGSPWTVTLDDVTGSDLAAPVQVRIASDAVTLDALAAAAGEGTPAG